VVHWTRRAVIIDFCLALAALVSPEQNITLFHFISPHRPATTWAVKRAGSPVSGVSDCDILVVVDIASFQSSGAILSSIPNWEHKFKTNVFATFPGKNHRVKNISIVSSD
jgi:hypothetical protein